MISCLRFTASNLYLQSLGCLPKLGDALPKEEEVYLHFSIGGNYCETARTFDINKSTVGGIVDACLLLDKMNILSKCNFSGAGRPLTYPIELDDELLKLIF